MADLAARLRADLRAAIADAGVNQAFVARALGVTQKHVSHMLTGRAAISVERAEQIALVCGRSLDFRITDRGAS